MKRTSLLAGTAISLFAMMPVVAQAATCNMLATAFVCNDLGSDPVSSADDNATVTVAPGASVVSSDEDFAPVALSGDNVAINNGGVIEQLDTGNGGHAITGAGDGVVITNSGAISSGDRGIEMLGGANLKVVNEAGATIDARRQAVRAGTDSPGAIVENAGTITSTDGRALQLRSYGARVINTGDLIGGEEVVEARGGFYLENHGTIRLIDPSIEDEDGVQFAGGEVQNFGLISGSDDGIDVDEGLIVNHAGGTIISTAPDANDNGGIDIDEVYDDGVSPERIPTALTIINEGTIEGPKAINTDVAAVSVLNLTNRGILRGRGGKAVDLAPGMDDSMVSIEGGSEIYGDVLFGAGDDTVKVASITSGLLSTGLFDGNLGSNTVDFSSFALAAFQTFEAAGNRIDLSFLSNGDLIAGTFLNFDNWKVGGKDYTTASLSAEFSNVAPVPLPATLPMILVAFGGLGLLRRRR